MKISDVIKKMEGINNTTSIKEKDFTKKEYVKEDFTLFLEMKIRSKWGK